jgi:hypothetical protein
VDNFLCEEELLFLEELLIPTNGFKLIFELIVEFRETSVVLFSNIISFTSCGQADENEVRFGETPKRLKDLVLVV